MQPAFSQGTELDLIPRWLDRDSCVIIPTVMQVALPEASGLKIVLQEQDLYLYCAALL